MEIYFDTRNITDARECYPMPRTNMALPLPRASFNVYRVDRYHRHGFDWKAILQTVVRAPDEHHINGNWYTADCYFRAVKIAWLRAWEYNNGGGGRLNDGSVATMQRLGIVQNQSDIWLVKIPTDVRVQVQGYLIGSAHYAVEKLIQT